MYIGKTLKFTLILLLKLFFLMCGEIFNCYLVQIAKIIFSYFCNFIYSQNVFSSISLIISISIVLLSVVNRIT